MTPINVILPDLIFFMFAGMSIFSAAMVIINRNPVRAVLFLILTFFSMGGLWVLLEMEFLAVTLVLVYIGAVMVLFLFVVMMLDVEVAAFREGFARPLWLGLIAMGCVSLGILYSIRPEVFSSEPYTSMISRPETYSQAKELGQNLYTRYIIPFEIAGVLLLVAIVAAISLTHRGRRGSKAQEVAVQVSATKSSRLRIIKMASSENSS